MNREELHEDDMSGPYQHDGPVYGDGVRNQYIDECPKIFDLLESCMQKDPEKRPSAEELYDQIYREVGVHRSDNRLPLKFTAIPEDQEPPLTSEITILGLAADRGS